MEEKKRYFQFGSTEYKALKVNSIDDLKPGMLVYSLNNALIYDVTFYFIKKRFGATGISSCEYQTNMYHYDQSRARLFVYENTEVIFSLIDFIDGRYLFDEETSAKIMDRINKSINIIQMQINAVRGLIEPILLDENKFQNTENDDTPDYQTT